jgi:hypothetical protein
VSHRITAKLLVDKEKIEGLSFQSYDCGAELGRIRYPQNEKLVSRMASGVSPATGSNLEYGSLLIKLS